MPSALFNFFEMIAEELGVDETVVITPDDFELRDGYAPLLEELQATLNLTNNQDAIEAAVRELDEHFTSKGGRLPFAYDRATALFTALDPDFLEFIRQMREIRSLGKRSREFELGVFERLKLRAVGSLHRVGHPRDVKRKSADLNAHLRSIGFNGHVLVGKDKDGGLDLLWVLPLGSNPYRPMVSIQCKNGAFRMEEADASLGAAGRTLSSGHAGLQSSVHVPCVLFNDYMPPTNLTKKLLNYVPLGISDLSALRQQLYSEAL